MISAPTTPRLMLGPANPLFFHSLKTHVKHSFHKVITIGEKMGWVDLWQGILLCDVHIPAGQEESPGPRLLRYIPLPEPMQPDNDLPIIGFASFFRDITVIKGLIKFVDLQIHASLGSRVPSGWTAVTWIMAPDDREFRKDVELHSHDIINPPELSLFVAHPTLSSHDDDVLYLMTKASLDDRASDVFAVNMKTKRMGPVAKFTTQREASMDYAYMRSTISNYLSPDPKWNLKRRGPVLQGSNRKKQPAINSSKDLPPWVMMWILWTLWTWNRLLGMVLHYGRRLIRRRPGLAPKSRRRTCP
uniref:Uncharacterized protein n=1 Tax=Avena sativa TaxID=4498 RepID=A0ACD5Y569_AVESA